jgi:hypothetical protein
MEAICSSEKSVDFQRTARPYIPENTTRQKDMRFKALTVVTIKVIFSPGTWRSVVW